MNSSTASPLIELRSVVKVYNSLAGSVTALNGIDLQIFQGEFLVVTGKSGSGKTTLVNMLTGLDRSTSGEIWVNGEPLHKFGSEKAAKLRGKTMGVVFQSFELLPTLTVLQNVMLPMDFALALFPLGAAQAGDESARTGGHRRPREETANRAFGRTTTAAGRLPVPWQTTPPSSSRMNPLAAWIRQPPQRSSTSSRDLSSRAGQFSWSRTTRTLPNAARG